MSLPVTTVYATRRGGALPCAACLRRIMLGRDFQPRVFDAQDYPPGNLADETALLLVTGAGEAGRPPNAALSLYERLVITGGLNLRRLRYSVAALGITPATVERHCGRDFDAALAAQGGVRVYPRLDCDHDYEVPFAVWTSGVLAALREQLPA